MKVELTAPEGTTHYKIETDVETGAYIITFYRVKPESFVVNSYKELEDFEGWFHATINRTKLDLSEDLYIKQFRRVDE